MLIFFAGGRFFLLKSGVINNPGLIKRKYVCLWSTAFLRMRKEIVLITWFLPIESMWQYLDFIALFHVSNSWNKREREKHYSTFFKWNESVRRKYTTSTHEYSFLLFLTTQTYAWVDCGEKKLKFKICRTRHNDISCCYRITQFQNDVATTIVSCV